MISARRNRTLLWRNLRSVPKDVRAFLGLCPLPSAYAFSGLAHLWQTNGSPLTILPRTNSPAAMSIDDFFKQQQVLNLAAKKKAAEEEMLNSKKLQELEERIRQGRMLLASALEIFWKFLLSSGYNLDPDGNGTDFGHDLLSGAAVKVRITGHDRKPMFLSVVLSSKGTIELDGDGKNGLQVSREVSLEPASVDRLVKVLGEMVKDLH